LISLLGNAGLRLIVEIIPQRKRTDLPFLQISTATIELTYPVQGPLEFITSFITSTEDEEGSGFHQQALERAGCGIWM
jgi:hypothetical protein